MNYHRAVRVFRQLSRHPRFPTRRRTPILDSDPTKGIELHPDQPQRANLSPQKTTTPRSQHTYNYAFDRLSEEQTRKIYEIAEIKQGRSSPKNSPIYRICALLAASLSLYMLMKYHYISTLHVYMQESSEFQTELVDEGAEEKSSKGGEVEAQLSAEQESIGTKERQGLLETTSSHEDSAELSESQQTPSFVQREPESLSSESMLDKNCQSQNKDKVSQENIASAKLLRAALDLEFAKIIEKLDLNTALICNQCPSPVQGYLNKCGIKIRRVEEIIQENLHRDESMSEQEKNKKKQILLEGFGQRFGAVGLKNRRGDYRWFLKSTHREGRVVSTGDMQLLANFLNPPHQLHTYDQYLELLSTLQNENEYLILTYIPVQPKRSSHQSWLSSYIHQKEPDYHRLESQFVEQKYRSCTSVSNYCIVREEGLANMMKIGTVPKEGGNVYLMYRSGFVNGMESNLKVLDRKYTVKRIGERSNQEESDSHFSRYDKHTYPYILTPKTSQELLSILSTHEATKDSRKLLLVVQNSPVNANSPSLTETDKHFTSRLLGTVLKASKIQHRHILTIYIDNRSNGNPNLMQALAQYLHVDCSGQFVGVRLIDMAKRQGSLILFDTNEGHSQAAHSSGEGKRTFQSGKYINKEFYSIRKFNGGFTIENLCQFVDNTGGRSLQHYESKASLSPLPSIITPLEGITPNLLAELGVDEEKGDLQSLVLHWKHGCQACKVFEKYLLIVNEIIQRLDGQEQGNKNADERQRLDVRYQYGIEDPKMLSSLRIYKYHILNESEPDAKSANRVNSGQHDATPQLSLVTSQKTIRPLEIKGILQKIFSHVQQQQQQQLKLSLNSQEQHQIQEYNQRKENEIVMELIDIIRQGIREQININ